MKKHSLRILASLTVWLALWGLSSAAEPAGAELRPAGAAKVVDFSSDPTYAPDFVSQGDALERLVWVDSAPAFPGDARGSLEALYHSGMSAGTAGWRLDESWTRDDAFTAAAILVIDSEDFRADPYGFFQISWGLWNSESTGLERTGNFESYAGDTFELLEWDYFPNVSPFFGGPYLSPALFGAANEDSPLFDALGSFANLSYGSAQTMLPLDQPLLAVIEQRPEDGIVVFSVQRITENASLLPIDGALAVVPIEALSKPEYVLDTVGLTLWHDGFGGEEPGLVARVHYHGLAARQGRVVLKEMLDALLSFDRAGF